MGCLWIQRLRKIFMHSEPIALGAVEPVWPESPACQRTHSDSLGQVSIDDGLDVKRGKLGGERLAVRGKRSVCASDATPEPEGPESLAECPWSSCLEGACQRWRPGVWCFCCAGRVAPRFPSLMTGFVGRARCFRTGLPGSNCKANRCQYVSYGAERSASIQTIKSR